jgi:hypothetical protein
VVELPNSKLEAPLGPNVIFFELDHQLSWLNTKTFVLNTYWSFRAFQSFCGSAKAKMHPASYGSPKQLAQELHEKLRQFFSLDISWNF